MAAPVRNYDKGATKCSVPLRVLMDAVKSTVAIEMMTGEVYRGFLLEVQDNMNCRLNNITVTHRDGRTRTLDHVFIRGSKVRFLVLPDYLMNKFKIHLGIMEAHAKEQRKGKRAVAIREKRDKKEAKQRKASVEKLTTAREPPRMGGGR
eukprot:NODE_4688_length_760_cov_53.364929_g4665_i0.p1 GENE.NODE_4688_length_760_cov_53.364929_g4665_i0~~NODE_4688_length_760_cov_53.364929_g4665_i0.p1  ORF type:complete len:149 (+),score=15.04 NODE_4688_length_760_cov_53.364929_g4665_i0:91-537(+)